MLKPPKKITVATTTTKKSVSAKPVKAEKSKEDLAKEAAKEIVDQVTAGLAEYDRLRAEFEINHPEEFEELKLIEAKRDEVRALIPRAKEAVKAARVTVGPFAVTIPKAGPGYKGPAVLEAFVKYLEEARKACALRKDYESYWAACAHVSELLVRLYNAGVIKEIAFDQKAGQVFHERFGGEQDEAVVTMNEGWSDGGEELWVSVKEPKL